MAKHEITKRSPRPHKSLVTDAAAASPRGIAFIEDPATPGKALMATAALPIAGFITREVKVGGPTLADAVYPNRTDLPTAAGEQASFELAEEFEAEGDEMLFGGTNKIEAATAIGTAITFEDGLPRIAMASEVAEYYLSAKPTPEEAGKLRCRFALLNGRKLPAS